MKKSTRYTALLLCLALFFSFVGCNEVVSVLKPSENPAPNTEETQKPQEDGDSDLPPESAGTEKRCTAGY